MSASTEPKCRARFCAVTQPTSGMFRPKSTRRNGIVCRDASIASIAFARRDLAVAVQLHQLLGGEPVEIGHRAEQSLGPEPPDELLADAVDVGRGADPVDQRLEPARGARAVRAAVHHLALGLDDRGAAERAVRRHPELAAFPARAGPPGPTTCGITSPARWTITWSPSRISLRLMSSSLCSVARETVTPPTCTGSRIAHGLSAPVRPTRIAIWCELRLRGRRRPLVGAGPARTRVERAEHGLLGERVDLDHDPVDLVVELLALRAPSRGRPSRRPRSCRAARRAGSCGSRARAATRASPSASRARAPRGARPRRPRSRADARP